MTRSKDKVRKLDFAFGRRPTGKSTPLISKAKCSSAERFSKSSIGTKDRRSCRSSEGRPIYEPRFTREVENQVARNRCHYRRQAGGGIELVVTSSQDNTATHCRYALIGFVSLGTRGL